MKYLLIITLFSTLSLSTIQAGEYINDVTGSFYSDIDDNQKSDDLKAPTDRQIANEEEKRENKQDLQKQNINNLSGSFLENTKSDQ